MSRLSELYASLEDTNIDDIGNELTEFFNVNEDVNKISFSAGEINDLEENSTELEFAYNGIKKLSTEMKRMQNAGETFSLENAIFAHIAVNAYISRLGLSANDVMPSLEAFVSGATSFDNTIASLESLSWKIRRATDDVKNKIKSSFKRFFNMFKRKIPEFEKKIVAVEKNYKLIRKEANIQGIAVAKVPFPNILKYKKSIKILDILDGLEETLRFGLKWAPEFMKLMKTLDSIRRKEYKHLNDSSKEDEQEKVRARIETVSNDLIQKFLDSNKRVYPISGDMQLEWVIGKLPNLRSPIDKKKKGKYDFDDDPNKMLVISYKQIGLLLDKTHKILKSNESLVKFARGEGDLEEQKEKNPKRRRNLTAEKYSNVMVQYVTHANEVANAAMSYAENNLSYYLHNSSKHQYHNYY